MMRLNTVFLAFAALLISGLAQAERRPVDETRALNADAEVSVRNVAGSIRVEAWDRQEIHISGLLGDNVESLEIDGSRRSLDIEVRYPSNVRNADGTRLDIRLPRGVSLDVEAVSADIEIRGVEGELEAESVSGDVRAEVGSRKVRLRSVSGDVRLKAPSIDTKLESVSGDVHIEGASGVLEAESVSGDLRADGGRFDDIEARTVSGDVDLRLTLAPDAEVEVESLSGEIELRVRGGIDAEVELGTFSGSLHSDFGGLGRGDAKSAEFTLGKGRGRIDLSTFSGNVQLRKDGD